MTDLQRDIVIRVGLGLVLAVLVVPFAGPYTLILLLGIAALVAFDIWRLMQPPGQSWNDRLREQPLWIRLIAIGFVLALFAVVGMALRS